jgi:DNA-directed RNA polymerase specialized sigma24 family protein
VETKEYVEYLLENYNEILKDIEQLKFELETFEELVPEEMIDVMNFSTGNEERVAAYRVSDKTCKIALIYNEVAKRMNNEAKEEIRKMIIASEYEIKKLDYCIDRLDEKVKETIKSVYINKYSWADVCKKLYISENTLNKYRRKGIEEIKGMFQLGRLAN